MSNISHEIFFVGGEYVSTDGQQVMVGQMYVEVLKPNRISHSYPLVFIHGVAQTATNWLTTPDGRQGWARWFAEHGWQVCMPDQPARGRSAWNPKLNGSLQTVPVSLVERLFTAPEDYEEWPQARLHSQWPGGERKGHPGDPAFDQFYASQVPFLGNAESEKLMQKAGAAHLDRIGPAILVTHSQGALFGWLIADSRPDLVKGIVALEPAGHPTRMPCSTAVRTGFSALRRCL
jgi:pimeloyl-ACP methyl ester carboxylesterase